MKNAIKKSRLAIAASMVAALSVLLSASAFATTTSDVETAVTPYFNDLKTFAIDMIPLVLGVVIVGLALRFGIGWLRKARS